MTKPRTYAERLARRRQWLSQPPPERPPDCKPVAGFPGYCVRADGTVFSCRGLQPHLFRPWTALKPSLMKKRTRQRVTLCREFGNQVNRQVHHIVLEAFVGPCPPGMEACHNDGNSLNCSASNLRWDTRRNNLADRRRHGTDPTGSRNPLAKLDEECVILIRDLHNFGKKRCEIANTFGVTVACINDVCYRRRWRQLPATLQLQP